MRYLLDVVSSTPGVVHHVAMPAHEGVAGRSGALADTTAAEHLTARGAQVHTVDMRRNPMHPVNAAAAVATRRVIAHTSPDVVHTHSSVGGLVGRLAARTAGVATVHTPNGLMTSKASVAFERGLGLITDRFVAVSASEGERVISFNLVPRGRIAVIPNGIDLLAVAAETADIRVRLGLAPGTPMVATVARLAAQKAPEEFVRTCAVVARRRADVHFLLVGLGPRQRLVDREVQVHQLAGHFHQIPHLVDAAAAMAQMDVFVLLSRYEGGPYAPLEAMRAGVPVVLSDVVGNCDTVIDGVTGVLTPFGDAGAAGVAVVRLLEDRVARDAMTEAASARLREAFDLNLMGSRLRSLYDELATRQSTRRLPQSRSGRSSN